MKIKVIWEVSDGEHCNECDFNRRDSQYCDAFDTRLEYAKANTTRNYYIHKCRQCLESEVAYEI